MLNRLLKLSKALEKSIIEQPDAGIDLNTAEQSLDELASRDNGWLDIIRGPVVDAGYGDAPVEINLPNQLVMYISKVDDGIFSAIVKKQDPASGDHGEVQCQLMKMTIESMVQGLKARGYIPSGPLPEVATNGPAPLAPVERKMNEFAGLYRVLKQHEGELHIHLHKALNDRLSKEIV